MNKYLLGIIYQGVDVFHHRVHICWTLVNIASFQHVGLHLFSPAMDVSSDCPNASLTFAVVCLRTLAILMDE